MARAPHESMCARYTVTNSVLSSLNTVRLMRAGKRSPRSETRFCSLRTRLRRGKGEIWGDCCYLQLEDAEDLEELD